MDEAQVSAQSQSGGYEYLATLRLMNQPRYHKIRFITIMKGIATSERALFYGWRVYLILWKGDLIPEMLSAF